MKRSKHWPYELYEEVKFLTEKDKRTIKSTLAIMLTMILSVWLGLMFARGL